MPAPDPRRKAGARTAGDTDAPAADGGDADEAPRAAAGNGEDPGSPDAPAAEVPEFLRVSP